MAETVHSSRLEALTGPQRWGLVRVAIFFGRTTELACQTCLPGDVLLEKDTGNLYVFQYREGNALKMDWYEP